MRLDGLDYPLELAGRYLDEKVLPVLLGLATKMRKRRDQQRHGRAFVEEGLVAGCC
jgi:hypothetical protein